MSLAPGALDILIVHDPREPVKKCSLTPLRGMEGVRFVPIRAGQRVDAGRRIWLHPDGEEPSPVDRGIGLLVVDCTWRRLSKLSTCIDGDLLRRRLPKLVTAYPRPERLAQYRWAAEFPAANPELPR